MIPGVTDKHDNITGIIGYILENKLDKHKIELLPYNELAEIKYGRTKIKGKREEKFCFEGVKRQSNKVYWL